MTQPSRADRAADPAPTRGGRRWLLFVHQLPSHPSNLRVATWRRLQQLGAVPLKQAVYALPDSPETREDFEWLKTEVEGAGGEASVFTAGHVDPWADDVLVEAFRRARQDAYETLAGEVEAAVKRSGSPRRPRGTRAPAVRRQIDLFRARLAAAEQIDFFGSAGRDRVLASLRALEERVAAPVRAPGPDGAASSQSATGFHGRLWITRPRPGVDRMSSAWLIHRFIDPAARFGFAADRESVPAGGVPFDMFGVEFGHQGEGCTFETLCTAFRIDAPAVRRIADIVHDVDLKEDRFGAPECGTVGAMVEGLRLALDDDHALLAQGMTFFDSLHRSFERTARATGPRLTARPKGRRTAPGGSRPAKKAR